MIRALILSGGKGQELLPLTSYQPKPLLYIGNYPLLLFQLYHLKKAGISEIVLSLSYQPRRIREILDDGSSYGLLLRYHVESVPLGTAGALKMAEHLVDDTTVVINGDILTEAPLQEMLLRHRQTKAAVTIGVCRVDNPQAYGTVEFNSKRRVTGFIERPRGKRVRTSNVNAGIYIVEPHILKHIPRDEPFYFEKGLFPILLEQKIPFYAYPIRKYWTEITRPDNYLKSNMDFLEGRIQVPQFAAYRKDQHRPANSGIQLDEHSAIDGHCIIKPGARIERSVIGSHCRIEEGAVVRNSVLWPSCRVQNGASISGSIIGRGGAIGEGCRIRAGNILGDKSTIAAYSQI